MEGPDSGAKTETVTRTKRQLILHAALVVLIDAAVLLVLAWLFPGLSVDGPCRASPCASAS